VDARLPKRHDCPECPEVPTLGGSPHRVAYAYSYMESETASNHSASLMAKHVWKFTEEPSALGYCSPRNGPVVQIRFPLLVERRLSSDFTNMATMNSKLSRRLGG